jgi:hypothetical protein
VGDNVLLAFKAGPHQWVVTMATMLVVVHVAAAFQVGVVGLALPISLFVKLWSCLPSCGLHGAGVC